MRKAYVLTVDKECERTRFSEKVLQDIGFEVELVLCTPHVDKVMSNKISMHGIYKKIAEDGDEWAYVFEDDINVLAPIKIDEIVLYERISDMFFYLGLCRPMFDVHNFTRSSYGIAGQSVAVVTGEFCRGLHAIGLSKRGAKALSAFVDEYPAERYMDVILALFTIRYPANVVRYDLESYCPGHRGVLFQDREKFPTQIP